MIKKNNLKVFAVLVFFLFGLSCSSFAIDDENAPFQASSSREIDLSRRSQRESSRSSQGYIRSRENSEIETGFPASSSDRSSTKIKTFPEDDDGIRSHILDEKIQSHPIQLKKKSKKQTRIPEEDLIEIEIFSSKPDWLETNENNFQILDVPLLKRSFFSSPLLYESKNRYSFQNTFCSNVIVMNTNEKNNKKTPSVHDEPLFLVKDFFSLLGFVLVLAIAGGSGAYNHGIRSHRKRNPRGLFKNKPIPKGLFPTRLGDTLGGICERCGTYCRARIGESLPESLPLPNGDLAYLNWEPGPYTGMFADLVIPDEPVIIPPSIIPPPPPPPNFEYSTSVQKSPEILHSNLYPPLFFLSVLISFATTYGIFLVSPFGSMFSNTVGFLFSAIFAIFLEFWLICNCPGSSSTLRSFFLFSLTHLFYFLANVSYYLVTVVGLAGFVFFRWFEEPIDRAILEIQQNIESLIQQLIV